VSHRQAPQRKRHVLSEPNDMFSSSLERSVGEGWREVLLEGLVGRWEGITGGDE